MIAKSALFLYLLTIIATVTQARSIPPNIQSFYDTVKTTPCAHPLKTGFQDGHGHLGFGYCGDYQNLIYITGTKSLPLADMDIDCDGTDRNAGVCNDDTTGQSQTMFQATAATYGIPDLNSSIHGYVVFGNEGSKPSFNPLAAGMVPLSVMAIVCGNQIFYGVWGDVNNGIYIGEASISLANACFPDLGVSGNKGYDGHDVLYLGFTGNNAAAGPGADWKARSFGEFEDSLAKVGDGLVAGVVVGENQNSDVDSAVLSRPRSWDAVCAWVLLVVLAIYK